MELFLKQTEKMIRASVQHTAQSELLDLVGAHFRTGGKLNRPRAVALISQAYQIDPEKSAAWAAAIELFHNGSLIHDDLQDGDVFRRGHPSLWVSKGTNKAMNAGTFLMLNAFLCLGNSTIESNKIVSLSKLLSKSAGDALEGQCREERLNRLTGLRGLRELYFNVVELKTASLFGCISDGLAVLGNLDERESSQLRETMTELGVLFQLQDDILDLYGDKQRDMQGNDIKEGKVSFLILKQLELYHYNLETVKKILQQGRNNIQRGEILVLKEQFAMDGTLESALDEFAKRVQSVLERDFLNERPRVRAAMSFLLGELVKPVSHLSVFQDSVGQALSNVLVRQEMAR